MTLLEESTIKLDFNDMLRRKAITRIVNSHDVIQQAERSSGKHISGIIKHLAIASKILKPFEQDEDDPTLYPLLWALGISWEEFCASFYPNIDYQPGELCVDNIYMTCDGIGIADIRDEPPCVEEFKFTFKKERNGKDFLDQWMWMRQGMCYCKGYGPRMVRWHVCYIRGDYKSFGPTYKRYLVEFTDKEIEKNWKMIKLNQHAAEAEAHEQRPREVEPEHDRRHYGIGDH